MKKHDIIELDVKILIDKPEHKAIMVKNLKGEDVWLPRSLIEIDADGIQIPEWLAIARRLV